MYPLFLYLQLVLVHTPTPDMFFYNCDNTGHVIEYHNDPGTAVFWYKVEFKCPNKQTVQEILREEQLRGVARK